MDLRSLYAVIAIADHGSFRDAASALDLSVSSISLQVSALEDHLGLKLFDRKTRPPAITDSGRSFVIRHVNSLPIGTILVEILHGKEHGGNQNRRGPHFGGAAHSHRIKRASTPQTRRTNQTFNRLDSPARRADDQGR